MARSASLLRQSGVLAVVAALLAACSLVDPGRGSNNDGTTDADGSDQQSRSGSVEADTPTPVAGVVSCAVLPQQPTPSGRAVDRLPPLKLPCLTPGPAVDLSALRGRPALVNLWATWCGPCREEMPFLQSSYERYGQEMNFLGVDTKDATEPAAQLVAEAGVRYPQVVDLDGELLNHLRIPGLPVTVVLDADGRVAGTHIGALDQSSLGTLLSNVR